MAPDDILEFWFGTLEGDGLATEEKSSRWWKKDPAFDDEIRERFGDTLLAAHRGELITWGDAPRSSLALVILTDQFPRNMFRGTADMFSSDGLALTSSLRAIERGFLAELKTHESVFLVMPTMHSEVLAIQRRCVELFEELAEDAKTDRARDALKYNVGFAEKHRVIVERFGRFPHRNALLGRAGTAEESAFLKEPGSSF